MILFVRNEKDENLIDIEIYLDEEKRLHCKSYINIYEYTVHFNNLSNGCVDYLWQFVLDTNYLNNHLVEEVYNKFNEDKELAIASIRKYLTRYINTYSIENNLRLVED